jgi:potassium-dependent mechanosensitive channel
MRNLVVALWLGWLLLLLAGGACAQEPADVDATLDAARVRVEQIRKSLGEELSDAQLTEYRRDLLALQQRSEAIALEQVPHLDSAQARLSELGAEPAAGAESADVAAQRRTLKKSSELLDARLKLARLLALESEQLSDEVGNQRRSRFRAQLFERTDSVLVPSFWADLSSGLRRDTVRLQQVKQRLLSAAEQTSGLRWLALLALVLATIGLRVWLARKLTDLASHRAPPGRVRRSLYAVAQTLLAILVPGVAAYALMLGLGGGSSEGLVATDPLRALFTSSVGAVCFSAYIAGLGHALLVPHQPSWRLLPLPDEVAHGLRWHPAVIGIVTFAGFFLQRLASTVPLSLAIEVAINGAFALVLGGVLVRTVHRGEQLRRRVLAAADQPADDERPIWLTLVLFMVWAVLVLSLLGIVVGYVALGSFVVRQITWISVLALSAYLLNLLIDDAFTAWLADDDDDDNEPGGKPMSTPGRTLRNQAVVLGSGALRLTIWLLALVLILAPFGESPGDLLQRTDQLREGIAIGELQLRPTAVLQSLIVFLLSLLALRVLKAWLVERFLPTTGLDAGMRSSVTTLLGFLGTVVAIGLGLSAIGLALDKVAWIASALSVGIGFGLQAVVSNFVSGLILLAERPVKVGDWVALGGVEGDIRRINVRATEIQMSDRSTVIVPNSEFITKVVRNVTHENPIGLVQIKLPMPLDCDADRVREILLRAFAEHEGVMDTPAPNVLLDSIDNGNLMFNATGFVGSPRQSGGVRSALLFRVLQDLREAGQPMWRAPSLVLRETAPPETPASDSP